MVIAGKITFEKMTNRDYAGTTYYTIRNVSLYECLGWCRDEVDCTAASFSFVVNPLAPIQETTCLLQNETQAKKPSSNNVGVVAPQKAVNMYFFTKAQLRSGKTPKAELEKRSETERVDEQRGGKEERKRHKRGAEKCEQARSLLQPPITTASSIMLTASAASRAASERSPALARCSLACLCTCERCIDVVIAASDGAWYLCQVRAVSD